MWVLPMADRLSWRKRGMHFRGAADDRSASLLSVAGYVEANASCPKVHPAFDFHVRHNL